VAISPLTTIGAWDKMNSIVAVVVGLVLVAFSWPRKALLGDGAGRPVYDSWTLAAHATVYGFIFAVGVAWPVQLPFPSTDCKREARRIDRLDCQGEADRLSSIGYLHRTRARRRFGHLFVLYP
jgi:hypothetical protein